MKIIEIIRGKKLPIKVQIEGKNLDIIESSDTSICANCDLSDVGEVQNGLFPEGLSLAIWNDSGFGSPLFKEMSIFRKGEGIRFEFAFRASMDTWEGKWNLNTYISALKTLAEKSPDINVSDMKLENIGGKYLTFILDYSYGRTIGESVKDAENKITDFIKLVELSLIKEVKMGFVGEEADVPLTELSEELISFAGLFAVSEMLCKIGVLPQISLTGSPGKEIIIESYTEMIRLQVRTKQGAKWLDLVSDFKKDDFFILVDYEGKMLNQLPNIYIVDIDCWKRLLREEMKRFPQINIDDKDITYPPSWKGLMVTPEQVDDCLNDWKKIREKVD